MAVRTLPGKKWKKQGTSADSVCPESKDVSIII